MYVKFISESVVKSDPPTLYTFLWEYRFHFNVIVIEKRKLKQFFFYLVRPKTFTASYVPGLNN